MKVIVAGLSKTGTKTMCAALKILDYKVYDNFEHYWFHTKEWMKIMETGGTINMFREMYEDVDAVTDQPACLFWEQILEAFPDAKVILTLRDEDSWWKSYKFQLEEINRDVPSKIFNFVPFMYSHRFLKDFCRVGFGLDVSYFLGQVCSTNEMVARMKFRQHNSYVLQVWVFQACSLKVKITDLYILANM
ncbi:unnamed protein product [Clavelina lepadiformis]|uniref:Sulfotransferase family protein n=1 Tax=Clavelina lepadiformis TaxID=159417 RepID=A0ABP0H316_CLALP